MEEQQELKLDFKISAKPAVSVSSVKLPKFFTDEMNEYIDKEVIPNDSSYADGLVGQIRQDKRSAQLDCKVLEETNDARLLKSTLDATSQEYLRQIGHVDSVPDVFEAWTVHSFSGDYNPLHAHGCQTPAGLSMIMYLKVPKCIEDKPPVIKLHEATGDIDGHTGLITSTNTIHDVYRLKLDAQEYIKPKKGFMIIFPNWLQHCVMPFFGDGERRTMSANFNIRDSKETVAQFKSPTLSKEH